MERPRAEVAFIAAALVLLVLPFLALMGLSALGLAAGLLIPMEQLMTGEAGYLLLTTFFLWVLLVFMVVLFLVRQIVRARSSAGS
jgi:uncharacterized membrane protein